MLFSGDGPGQRRARGAPRAAAAPRRRRRRRGHGGRPDRLTAGSRFHVEPRTSAPSARLADVPARAARPDPRPPLARRGRAGPDFAAIRAEFDVPEDFPADVLAEAERRAARAAAARARRHRRPAGHPRPGRQPRPRPGRAPRRPGRTATGSATRSPTSAPSSRSAAPLDARGPAPRADALQPRPADPAAPAGAQRGRRQPAAPTSSGRPSSGRSTSTPTASRSRVDLRRARVRSRAQLDYPSVQAQADAGDAARAAGAAARRSARCSQQRAAERGAIELGTPDQEVVADAGRRLDPRLRGDLPVEGWNAQISLLTGRCAAALMLDGGVGVLRTLPPARPRGRRPAAAAGARARRRLAGRTPAPARSSPGWTRPAPAHAAFLEEAVTLLRGAAYTPFDGAPPEQPGHAASRRPYAHVTAPLRRLVDRFGTEVCLALAAGARAGARAAGGAARAARRSWPPPTGGPARWSGPSSTPPRPGCCTAGRGRSSPPSSSTPRTGKGTVVLDDLAIRGRCTGRGPAARAPGCGSGSRRPTSPAARVRFTPAGAP